jgi:hypothetical protein
MLSNIAPNPDKYWLGTAISVKRKTGGVYEIYSAEQLAWIAVQTRNGETFKKKTVKLMNDIDMAGKEWSPIGA